MKRLSSLVRRVRGATVLSSAIVLALVGTASPAVAASDHPLSIRGTAVCDAEARQWVITWTLTNSSDVAGTIGNLRVYPPSRPLVGLPNRIPPGASISGVQRTLASEYSASLVFDVNWDDGPVTYDHSWPTYIHAFCAAA